MNDNDHVTALSPYLSFGENIFLAEESLYIHVLIEQSMELISNSYYVDSPLRMLSCFCQGIIGPFERGSYITVPFHLARLLAKERIGIIQVPEWLQEQNLTKLVSEESMTDALLPCPHDQYIELAHLLINNSQDPWASLNSSRTNVLRYFEELLALRENKIIKYRSKLLEEGTLDITMLSNHEKRYLLSVELDYVRDLLQPPNDFDECLEDLLASVDLLDAESHYALMGEVQEICEKQGIFFDKE